MSEAKFIEKEPCDVCGQKPWRRIRGTHGKTLFLCEDCPAPLEMGSFATISKVFIAGYGYTEQSRINELKRRTILPYDAPDGGYYIGRKGENGKIAEKEPNY